MRVLIVGAGIAGLTLANALERGNFDVDIIEKRHEAFPQGSGIMLGLNAVMALNSIGLAKELEPVAREIDLLRITDNQGRVLTETDASTLAEKYDTATFAIARETLHAVLTGHLKRTVVQYEKTVKFFNYYGRSIQVAFNDGNQHSYDLVIGADGIHSQMRTYIWEKRPLRYSGYACWRFLFEHAALEHEKVLTEMWGRGKRFGIVPLGGNVGYCFATVNTAENNEAYKNISLAEFRKLFSEFSGKADWALKSLKSTEDLSYDELRDQPDITFGDTHCILIGDAAHAMTPNMGEGAAMAIEDAVYLGALLRSGMSIENVATSFRKRRIKKVASVQNQSFKLGKIAQMESACGIKLRNVVLKMLPASMMLKSLEKTLIEKGNDA